MIPLNAAEWLIEPFNELHITGSKWKLAGAPGTGAVCEPAWQSLTIKWSASQRGTRVGQIERNFGVDLKDADRLALRGSMGEDLRLTMRAIVDGAEQVVISDAAGENRFFEYEGVVTGKSLERVIIEVVDTDGGQGQVDFLWLIAINNAARDRLRKMAPEFDASWPAYLEQEDVPLAPQLGILLPDDGVEGVQRRIKTPAYKAAWQQVEKVAHKFADSTPELGIRNHITQAIDRYEHDVVGRAEEKSRIFTSAMQHCALVGLVNEDYAMARMALRHALSAAQCEHWDDSFMMTRAGTLWDHRGFTQQAWMEALAPAIDWAGALLTYAGRDLLARAISERVLPKVDLSLRKYEYMRHNNQGIVFARAGVLAVCTLGRLWDCGSDGLDWYLEALRESCENYFLADGGSHEGGAYHDWSCSLALSGFMFAARLRNVDVASLLPPCLLETKNYYRVMASTSTPGGFINVSDGGRCGMRFTRGSVPTLARMTGDMTLLQMTAGLAQADVDGNIPGCLDLVVEGPDELPEAKIIAPEFDILPDTGMLCSCRTTPAGPVRLQLVGAAANAGHSHEDKGSMVLEAYGEEMLIDRGTAFYGDSRSSLMKCSWLHNLLTPDDADGNPCHQQNPTTEAILPAGQGDGKTLSVKVDCTAAWLKELSECIREIKSDEPECFTITDRAVRLEPGTVSLHFQSRFPWTETKSGWKTTGQSASVTIAPQWDVVHFETAKDLFDSNYKPVYRLTLRTRPGEKFELVTALICSVP